MTPSTPNLIPGPPHPQSALSPAQGSCRAGDYTVSSSYLHHFATCGWGTPTPSAHHGGKSCVLLKLWGISAPQNPHSVSLRWRPCHCLFLQTSLVNSVQANQKILGTRPLVLHLEGSDFEASYSTSLSLSSLICEVEIMITLCQSKEFVQAKHDTRPSL